jgi:hypothetical protein
MNVYIAYKPRFFEEVCIALLACRYSSPEKRGLSVPLSSWLREPLYDWAKAKLSSPLLASVAVNQFVAVDLLQEHMQRKADHARAIWTLCVLCEWLEWVSEATAETPKNL